MRVPGGRAWHHCRVLPVDAVLSIASSFGIDASEPVTLSDSNNVVLWLRPAPVVAKVATGHHHSLALELAVGKHLATLDAPAVPPAGELPRRVHQCGDFEVTFWTYQTHHQGEADPHQLGQALFQLHAAMRTFRDALPSFLNGLSAVDELLRHPGRVPDLPERDRVLLLSALARLSQELAHIGAGTHPLHGSPHDANTLVTDGGIRFVDFETACLGPIEWDLAHVSAETVSDYPGTYDPDALATCRALVSVKTAAWCWANFGHPSLRWHAKHHLSVVRRLMAH